MAILFGVAAILVAAHSTDRGHRQTRSSVKILLATAGLVAAGVVLARLLVDGSAPIDRMLIAFGGIAVFSFSIYHAFRGRRFGNVHDPLIAKLTDPRTSAQAFEQILGRSDASQLFREGLTLMATPDTLQGVELAQELSAEGLGRLKAIDAVDALVTATRGSSFRVRKAAVQALGEIGEASAVPALLELLSNTELRLPAIRALGALGDRSALRHLIPFLGEDGLSIAVGEALNAMGARALVDAYRGALQGDEALLASLGQHEARVEIARAIATALTSNDASIAVNAARALSTMGAVESMPDLRSAERNARANESLKQACRDAIARLEGLASLPRTLANVVDTASLPRATVERTTPERETLPRASG